ncbi:hydroxymethylglutaryl-CoA lyase [Steroidobacter sp.]|uniref:hydroxymethylglutaryl-CoA lyase n=1 Tax=Steroidobacter sp. TaxID=1978227 RepID=UPI001A5E0853|nr:hydroxymethylglutaryl-CoA lyase [Steroidobacter sp.]MBL8271362.1 hydroxymethylglutaryl-CoA lyase [Steroidobacter sp.]
MHAPTINGELAATADAAPSVRVREVGPRDGLQAAGGIMPTATKLRWITAMARAGLREMEVASFVPPATLPQMADATELTRSVRRTLPSLRAIVLAPNFRGLQDAVAAGARQIVIPVSASQAHSQANVRRSIEQQIAAVAQATAWVRTLPEAPRIEAGVATAFGCSLQGVVSERDVVSTAVGLVEAGVDVVSLADTLGYATPSQVKRLVKAIRSEVGEQRFGNLHLHDTLGTALANICAALEEGVQGFDSSLGGFGGCPYAPGSAGNVATEDVVYLLESEGLDTGIDLRALIAAGDELRAAMPEEQFHSRIVSAGIPRTYQSARGCGHS